MLQMLFLLDSRVFSAQPRVKAKLPRVYDAKSRVKAKLLRVYDAESRVKTQIQGVRCWIMSKTLHLSRSNPYKMVNPYNHFSTLYEKNPAGVEITPALWRQDFN